jgi:hydrogenase maturation protease
VTSERGTLVIGVGHPDRGDDGAGVAVVRALGGSLPPDVTTIELGDDVTRLLTLFQKAPRILIVDAMRSGEAPGTIRRFDARSAPLPADAFRGTSAHAIDVANAIELGRALDLLPEELLVFGIAGQAFARGAVVSPPVSRAVPELVALVLAELKTRGPERPVTP